jgi:hypothetical protein
MSESHSADPSNHFIADAGELMIRARALLVRPAPQNLDIACSCLAIAITRITDVQAALAASPSREPAAGVLGLRDEVRLISSLLEHAASYHTKLIQCMIEAAGSGVPEVRGPKSAPHVSLMA